MNYLWTTHTRDEIREKVNAGWKTVILPLGAIEQHGPHLVVGYDSFIAEKLAADLAVSIKGFVLPAVHYGMSTHHLGFHGTVTLSESTMLSILNDIARSVHQSGIQRLVLINGHGGNYKLIGDFAETCSLTDFRIIHDAVDRFIFKTIADFSTEYAPADLGLHAGQFETSLALHTHPHAVRNDKREKGHLPPSGTWTSEGIKKVLAAGLAATTCTGVIGDPCPSTAAQGQRFYDRFLRYYEELCK